MDRLVAFLQEVPFFSNLAYVELEKVASLLITRKYERGINVFLEGGDGDEFYVIYSGNVKIYKESVSREIILAIFGEGDFFGEMAVLENETTRSASAMTLEETTLYVLKRQDFLWLMNQTPQIPIKIMNTAMQRLRTANELIKDLTFRDAKTRIAKGLYRLVEKHGVQKQDNILIDLKLTHQQIADLTGTVRETVTKVMQELQTMGILKIEKKRITITDHQQYLLLFDEE
ncbi:Crp/Fnr family transcriptional regulator [Paenibacillus yanchengensis]|uniref:Crp/Fnr family transcriptional regulator n=1 Tax=Paenibacillus yanchengensis TaxID=2035833 RepID=A0ABW4YJQ8_9BACL